MPTAGPVAKELRKHYDSLVAKYGCQGFLDLYEEKGVYNLYTDTIHVYQSGMGHTLQEDVQISGLDSDEQTCAWGPMVHGSIWIYMSPYVPIWAYIWP